MRCGNTLAHGRMVGAGTLAARPNDNAKPVDLQGSVHQVAGCEAAATLCRAPVGA